MAGFSEKAQARYQIHSQIHSVDDNVSEFTGSVPVKLDFSHISRDLAAALGEAARLMQNGLAPRLAVEDFLGVWSPAFAADELHGIVVAERTLARRKAKSELLTVEETDRALRLARTATDAQRVFGDAVKAGRWLRKPNRALNGLEPLRLLQTETGGRTVEELLGQIDHGIFA
jgi:putative toxin-antitoxin system antitoxin component (TIGR02293 family)